MPRSTAGEYARFLALTGAILAGLVALGALPTRRLGGDGALTAMLVALAVCVFASVVGSLPILGRRGRPLSEAMPAMLGSVALRLAVVLFVGALLAFSRWVTPAPFLLWLAIGHAALLVPDTLLALRATRDPEDVHRHGGTARSLATASES